MAYAIFVRWGYGRLRAALGGAMVALAPFEVVLGSLRANDSYLELALAAGFTGLVLLERRPVWQGLVVAIALWFGFYVKLWVVYALPALGLYFLLGRRWRALASFVISTIAVHGATCLYWKAKTGGYFPFFSKFAANYKVEPDQLVDLFLKYPRLMFVGSFEFPTTLWGAVPYVLHGAARREARGRRRPHAARRAPLRPDDPRCSASGVVLLACSEFFPNGSQFDGYYSCRASSAIWPDLLPDRAARAKCVLDRQRLPSSPREQCRRRRAGDAVAAPLRRAVNPGDGAEHNYR
jgi:hypothetical protein